MADSTVKPQAAVRRFDIFAEYNRRKAAKQGQPAAQAKGYGLWLAKLVAARRFRRENGEKEIVQRMGTDFYRRVFSPAVRRAFERGEPYEAIRDSLRASWKPAAKQGRGG
jgi:hypothetical protein